MATYVVMQAPEARDEQTLFIRDSFSFLAFVLPFVWLLWNRLWLETLLFVAASLLLGFLAEYLGLGFLTFAFSVLLALFVGLEGRALRIAALRRRGWHETAVIDARDREEAEIRYFASSAYEPPRPAAAPPMQPPERHAAPAAPAGRTGSLLLDVGRN